MYDGVTAVELHLVIDVDLTNKHVTSFLWVFLLFDEFVDYKPQTGA